MAVMNKVDNTASVTYGGATIKSNTVSTLLLLAPIIVKAVDKATASIGDTLTYTVTITNPSLADINNLPFTDTIAAGSTYQSGTFQLNGVTASPTVTNNTLTYTIPTVPAGRTVVITFQVLVNGGAG